MSEYENILVSQEGRVKIIQLNRPKALNALNMPLMLEVLAVCQEADDDEGGVEQELRRRTAPLLAAWPLAD